MEVLSTKDINRADINVVVANYKLSGGVTKQASLNIWSLKVGQVEETKEMAIAAVMVTSTVAPKQHADAQAQEAHLLSPPATKQTQCC